MSKKKAKYNFTMPETLDQDIQKLQEVIKKEFKIDLSKSEIVRMILNYSLPQFHNKLNLKKALMKEKHL